MKHGEKIVVFGFGSQGSAQAQNLRDSGRDVSVFVRPKSPRIADVKRAKIPAIADARRAAQIADIAVMLMPDGEQPKFYSSVLEKYLRPGAAIIFAHGFAIHYKGIVPRPDIDVILVAPLAHALAVRSSFKSGGVPLLIAVDKNFTGSARKRANAYAKAISPKGPFIKTTFAEEVETDLFAEQALLCGGMPELVRAAFETLVNAGYNRDIAYFCCLRELKPIIEIMDKHGIDGLRQRISDTARYGALTRGPRVVAGAVRREMKKILDEIRSGKFAEELIGGKSVMKDKSKYDRTHEIERAHKRLTRRA